jgi:hypothetical protein
MDCNISGSSNEANCTRNDNILYLQNFLDWLLEEIQHTGLQDILSIQSSLVDNYCYILLWH